MKTTCFVVGKRLFYTEINARPSYRRGICLCLLITSNSDLAVIIRTPCVFWGGEDSIMIMFTRHASLPGWGSMY